MKTILRLSFAALFSLSLPACSKDSGTNAVSLSNSELLAERISMKAATLAECANGGTALKTYIDANGNSALDASEQVLASSVICAGAPGSNGTNGMNGTNGTNGTNGADGTNGSDGRSPYGVVFLTTAEAPGCKYGGSTILFALDTNENGVFDEKDEQSQSIEICSGKDGKKKEADDVPIGDFGCAVKVEYSSVTKEGYRAEVTVQYFGSAREGWKVEFTLPKVQRISARSNARLFIRDGKVVAKSRASNESIEDGSKISFAIRVIGSDDSMLKDSVFTLNGVTCKY